MLGASGQQPLDELEAERNGLADKFGIIVRSECVSAVGQ